MSFHAWISIAFLLTAIAGFAPTYYLKGLSHARPLSPLLHFHGLVFTAWLLLLVTQSTLLAKGRVAVHRRLGIAGAVLAALMVPLGIVTAVGTAPATAARNGLEPAAFLIFPMGQMVLFGLFMTAAIWKRRDAPVHRRSILLATACLMPPAIVRLPLIGQRPLVALALSTIFVVAGIVHDWRSQRRVHSIYLAGAFVILLSGPLRFGLGRTEAWQVFAQRCMQAGVG